LGVALVSGVGPAWALIPMFLIYMAQDAYTTLRVENEVRSKNGKPPLFK